MTRGAFWRAVNDGQGPAWTRCNGCAEPVGRFGPECPACMALGFELRIRNVDEYLRGLALRRVRVWSVDHAAPWVRP